MTGGAYQGARGERQAVVLRGPGWCSPPLIHARSTRQRLVGVHGATGGVLLRARSVHGFGLRSAIAVLVLDREGLVLTARVVRRGEIVWVPGAAWIAEFTAPVTLPAPGSALSVSMLAPCRDV
jgi:hypothetical protein